MREKSSFTHFCNVADMMLWWVCACAILLSMEMAVAWFTFMVVALKSHLL